MQTIRAFETRVEDLFKAGELPGFVHSSAGQEAIAVGVCHHLTRTDYITSTHRGHGHAIAKGISLDAIFAELYGKEAGACHGRGGSMHVADFSIGMLGANGIVGGGFGIATGAALAIKYQRRGEVAVCFFGDGAANKGTFHEALNFAGVHELPVVFVCENNRYAQFTSASRTTAVTDIAVRAGSYGIAGDSIDGNDLVTVIESAGQAIERAKNGGGATLINMLTYRHSGHFVGDAEQYRSRDEVEASKELQDPIVRFVQRMMDVGVLTEAEVDEIEAAVGVQIDAANDFAVAAPYPEPADALRHVWTVGSPQ
ncbi:MAG: thiamine pyrophosphate-dependent dehydrogenase E1 component subunit alpha [Ilumatobacteraceae bacterium]